MVVWGYEDPTIPIVVSRGEFDPAKEKLERGPKDPTTGMNFEA